jgi:hypothetical protein
MGNVLYFRTRKVTFFNLGIENDLDLIEFIFFNFSNSVHMYLMQVA